MNDGSRSGSPAYDRAVRYLLVGDLKGAEALLGDDTLWMRCSERAELLSAIEFHRGTLRSPGTVNWLARLSWRIWLDLPFGDRLLFGALQFVAWCLGLVGLRARVFEELRLSLAPKIVHFRYTDFVQGLLACAVLYAFAPDEQMVIRGYYGGLLGMFECLGGKFARGLDHLDVSHGTLAAADALVNGQELVDADVYERHLSIAVIRGLYLSYAGRHQEARREYDRVLERTRLTARYVLIEIFMYSVRVYSDLELLDARALAVSASELRKLLGTYFRGKFGLRASVCASIVAIINGNADFARQQLAWSDELYSENLSAIELGRYHFLRALVHLEASELDSARLHARRGAAFAANVRGSRFHQADMLLLELELRLRAQLREGALRQDRSERIEIERMFAKARRLVSGSPLVDVRVRALRLFARFMAGEFGGERVEFVRVTTLARQVSPRIEYILREIDTGRGEKSALTLAAPDAKRQADLTLLDRFGKILRNDGGDDEAIELLKFLVGAESCEVEVEPGLPAAVSGIDVRPEDGRLDVVVSAGGQRCRYYLRNPLVDISFDRRAAELVNLAAEMVRFSLERKQLLQLDRHIAIAQTTQMLAHDVRRPFNILQAAMKAIASARSPQEVRGTVDALLPEVQRAANAVSDLIEDVVELGIDRAPRRHSVLPELMLEGCITDGLRMVEVQNVSVGYSLQHTRVWEVEPVRVQRLLANLIGNAVQAMRGRGRLWVRSRDVGDQVEMVIGNDGPQIASEDLPQIFQAFFTKGKAGGTGLGLAIAHHIVTTHGGQIRCGVGEQGGVEFVFSLPAGAAGSLDEHAAAQLRERLPLSNASCALVAQREPAASGLESGLSEGERGALERLPYIGRPLDVLLVDCDQDSLRALTTCLEQVTRCGTLRISCVTGEQATAAVLRERVPDLAVVGDGLGLDLALDIARTIKGTSSSTFVCIHAEADSLERLQSAAPVWVDDAQQKPLTGGQAVQLLAAAIARGHAPPSEERRPLVALIDDSRVHLADWRGAMREDVLLRFFPSPAAFWAASAHEPELLASLDAVIVDYAFYDSEENGLTLARELKRRRKALPVCLCSSGFNNEEELDGAVDLVLEKAAISWSSLRDRIAARVPGSGVWRLSLGTRAAPSSRPS